ncbi:hypothetical protein H2200_005578 [Cladophialophora chaetospira]|uniref:Epoxide hydrolase N-terminal domain-containing protein n=1 Tax=Cladophialophora chaetospira TaxID=386627 RepID=A0AA39CJZ5_9EURO|nr:hypothetical protein H2200_005578 [Cladophialophora chaetospira]
MTDSDIQPYKISVPDSKVDRLKQKLDLYDLPTELSVSESPPWERGPPIADISRLARYWRNGYDWRKHEARLNATLPQFMTTIILENFGTYDIHFVHAKAEGVNEENAIPLLFAHGWPGSFLEVSKILPLLVNGDGKASPRFHVVAPSLVDFGFSGPSLKAGFTVKQHGEICHQLMLKLGYDQYVVQGGDLGYGIARYLALTYPSHCVAHHINLALPGKPTADKHPDLHAKIQSTPLTDWEKRGLARGSRHEKSGGGYMAIQSTRPQTIGIALAASPVALLAWIYDKLHSWTDGYDWTDDEILTWISIYEFSTAGPAGSLKIYFDENNSSDGPPFFWTCGQEYSHGSKLGISRFPAELSLPPKLWHHIMGEVVLMKEHDKGGHFAAWEVPDALVGDLREMFGRGGGAEGVVKGRSGYDERRKEEAK